MLSFGGHYFFERKKRMKKISLLLALLLLFALTSCQNTPDVPETPNTMTDTAETVEEGIWVSAIYKEDTEIGEGDTKIEVEVEAESKKITLTVNTNAETLADALLENSLIEGEDGQYGIYIKVVNGIRADYDKDKKYWGLYKNGEYLMSGADTTPIADGEHYEFVYSK